MRRTRTHLHIMCVYVENLYAYYTNVHNGFYRIFFCNIKKNGHRLQIEFFTLHEQPNGVGKNAYDL